jgi:hypothetical protein
VSDRLRATEEKLAEAIRSSDRAAAEPLLSEEFVLTSSLGTGLRVEREQWLRTLTEIATETVEFRDFQARDLGETGVVVFLMDFRARRGDDDLGGPYVVTDVWRGGRLSWRCWARLNASFLQEQR